VQYSLTIPLGPVEAFVLIATRVLAVLATSPVVSVRSVPAPARLGLGLFTALLLVPAVARDGLPSGVNVTWTAIASEAAIGALAGFAATLVYTAVQLGASVLDLQAEGGWRDPRMPGRYTARLDAAHGAMARLARIQEGEGEGQGDGTSFICPSRETVNVRGPGETRSSKSRRCRPPGRSVRMRRAASLARRRACRSARGA
jgi:hypothetical protein